MKDKLSVDCILNLINNLSYDDTILLKKKLMENEKVTIIENKVYFPANEDKAIKLASYDKEMLEEFVDLNDIYCMFYNSINCFVCNELFVSINIVDKLNHINSHDIHEVSKNIIQKYMKNEDNVEGNYFHVIEGNITIIN